MGSLTTARLAAKPMNLIDPDAAAIATLERDFPEASNSRELAVAAALRNVDRAFTKPAPARAARPVVAARPAAKPEAICPGGPVVDGVRAWPSCGMPAADADRLGFCPHCSQ